MPKNLNSSGTAFSLVAVKTSGCLFMPKASCASWKVPTQSNGFIVPCPVMSLNIGSRLLSFNKSLPKIPTTFFFGKEAENMAQANTHLAHWLHHNPPCEAPLIAKFRLQLENNLKYCGYWANILTMRIS